MEKKLKLNFELVPDGCWASNLRSVLSKEQWDYVRKDAYSRANGRCMICGASGRLEAHERWEYVITGNVGVQKLVDVIAVCKSCHEVIHIGRTQLLGNEENAINHFNKVNGTNYSDYISALGDANKLHKERNKVYEWALDVSWLKRFV